MASSSAATPSTAAPSTPSTTVTPDTLITIKVAVDGNNRRFKLPLRDLNGQVFPDKLRSLLQVSPDRKLQLERFSDSSTSYVYLDPNLPSTYKQLYRAAKAKLKLRIKATVIEHTLSNAATAPLPTKDVQQASKSETSIASEPVAQPEVPIKQESLPDTPTEAKTEVKSSPSEKKPLPRGIAMGDLARLCGANMTFRPKTETLQLPAGSWQVYCNSCDKPMNNAHFHCSICDFGDYDLCEACVDSGKLCPGEGHWLIKRYVENGKVVNSTTERTAPKPFSSSEKQQPEMPGAFTAESKAEEPKPAEAVRTCNGCVRVLPEKLLVTCKDCDDFDFCMSCHVEQKNGHHPGHTFAPVVDGTPIPKLAQSLCSPGRNVEHAAICDSCDKTILGVRHKCLECPDWDLCNACIKDASTKHSGHRFVPAYEKLAYPRQNRTLHYGVYCDGLLCKDKPKQGYIRGLRYKCAICHDLDFCANCEAHPNNDHNVTHPLIKFKTAFDHVTTATIQETAGGKTLATMGDKFSPHNDSTKTTSNPNTETLPPYSVYAAPKPAPTNKAADSPKQTTSPSDKHQFSDNSELDARFVRDIVQDGSQFPPDFGFQQVWTLRNPGPHAWPAGCRVRHVGGDNMLNIRRSRVASVSELAHAMESEPTEEIIEPGREIDFPVCMRTPSTPGKYISYWRLQAPSGMPFGHKLWCDVEVKADAPFPSQQPRNSTGSAVPPPPAPMSTASRPQLQASTTPYPMPQVTRPSCLPPPPHVPMGRYTAGGFLRGYPPPYRSACTVGERGHEARTFEAPGNSSGEAANIPHHHHVSQRRPGRSRPDHRLNGELNRADCMRPAFRPWPVDSAAKPFIPPPPRMPNQVAVPNVKETVQPKSEKNDQASVPNSSATRPFGGSPYSPRNSFGYDTTTGYSPFDMLASRRSAVNETVIVPQRQPHHAMNPYAMPTNDLKAAHAAAAAAAATSAAAPARSNSSASEQAKKLADETPSESGKKFSDIRDYLIEKKSKEGYTYQEDAPNMQSSTMVFPKIEKDGSPASSTNLEPFRAQNAEGSSTKEETAPSEAATTTTTDTQTVSSALENEDEDEAFEDLTAVDVQFDDEAADSESEDNGFLTDEEYDILDASDEEIMFNPGQTTN